ncbi:hypothetical protein GALMADRAFT_215112 [Galerina marginata CBS 339.88]|uniref:Uncharacterized protein n=1 Tax=Galerina marginata (strain CBS 339.88) TaxID=685588 RepID=A0A067SRR5_GALM3|nr:hypothetical protein GALMADRAFT_215112 [Galerina marginata CBS 339.88]
MKFFMLTLAFLATLTGSTIALPLIKGENNGYTDYRNSADDGAIFIDKRGGSSKGYWRGPSWPGPAGATAQATASATATSGPGGGPVSANANAIAAIGLNGGSNRGGSGGNGGSISIGKRGGLRL